MRRFIEKISRLVKTKPEVLVYVYFLLLAFFLLLRVRFGVGPDEETHFRLIRYYALNTFDPALGVQTTDFDLGSIQREVSYLYHYLLSFPYRVSELFGLPPVYVLRIINMFMGLGTLVFLTLISKQLKIKKLLRFAILFFIASVPVFVFLSASINYDNMVILITSATIHYSIRNYHNFSVRYSLAIITLCLAGLSVKFAFAPIAVVAGAYLVHCGIKNTKVLKKELSAFPGSPTNALIALAFVLVLLLFSQRYMVNTITYRQINPSCSVILNEQKCRQNFVYERTRKYEEANIQRQTIKPEVYVINWVRIMMSRTYGILAHVKLNDSQVVIKASIVGLYLLVFAFIRKYSLRKDKYWIITGSFIFYTAALLLTNYAAYMLSGNIELAVSGRYWLPVAFPMILLTVSLYSRTRNQENQLSLFFLLAGVVTGFPYLLFILQEVI